MPHPENVQANLERQFDKVDEMYANDDLRVFGRDTNRIFKEIDVIRRKQIELATEHISLESIDDMSLIRRPTGELAEEESKRNLMFFSKKEKALKSLMNKLDALGQIMNDFREASELNPHTSSATTGGQAISSETTKEAVIQTDAPNTQNHYSSNEDGSNENTPRASSSHLPQLSIPVFSFDQSSK